MPNAAKLLILQGFGSESDTAVLIARITNLTVSCTPYACMLTLQAAGAAWQEVDEADRETAADAGDRVRHVPLRPDRHHAAGNPWVAQVP